jgi:hypothetical protein
MKDKDDAPSPSRVEVSESKVAVRGDFRGPVKEDHHTTPEPSRIKQSVTVFQGSRQSGQARTPPPLACELLG